VIAIADRMPEVGRKFYESGPAAGIAQLAAYLAAQVEAGVLVVEDCEIAAIHGIDPRHSVQADRLQFRAGAERRAGAAQRPHRGGGVSRGVPGGGQAIIKSLASLSQRAADEVEKVI